MDAPQLFDARGQFIEEVDLSALTPEQRERAERVRQTHHVSMAVEQQLADAMASVNRITDEMADLEKFARANFPKPSFHDLWRENFGPQNRGT